mgnify:CR=1 FL=1
MASPEQRNEFMKLGEERAKRAPAQGGKAVYWKCPIANCQLANATILVSERGDRTGRNQKFNHVVSHDRKGGITAFFQSEKAEGVDACQHRPR